MRRLLIALVMVICPSLALAQSTIVIDPGHGGADPGGTGTGMQEKLVVLDVSTRFKALLDADTADDNGGGKWSALLTRSDDTFVSLAGRSAYSNNNGADRFMSIHSNAFGDPSANGTETFAFAEGGQGAALRNLVQEEMLAAWGLRNRGNKTANFAVLRDTAAPAVLHELAFITNATDAAKLGSPTERQKAAEAHLRAIQRHLGLAPYIPGSEPVQDLGAIAGRVVDDLGPVANATIRLDSGEEVVTPEDGTFVFEGIAVGTRGLTASAEGHDERMVEIAVAKGVQAETEIALSRNGNGDGDGDGDEDENKLDAGCSTGGDTSALLLVLAFAAFARRRRVKV